MIKHFIIVIGALALGGCTSPTRPCPGFGTPLADKWNTGRNIGDIITYASETGATVALELTMREDSEPYEGVGNPGGSDVTCRSNSDRQYSFANSDVALLIEQRQNRFEDPSREEFLSITIEPESPAIDAVAGFAYVLFVGAQARERYTNTFDPNHNIEVDPRDSRFIENLQIGNNIYPYAVEQKFVDLARLTNVTDANAFATITRVIVAEDAGNGGGLVQFELLNGEVYSRI